MTVSAEGTGTISIETIKEAASRIAAAAHYTPVLKCTTLNQLAIADPTTSGPRSLFFKCENFQKVGAFKFRGAYNSVAKLCEQLGDGKVPGVVTHSSGNHGQALALAAQLKGVPCFVIMPSNAPQVKKDAVRGYGATIVECEPSLIARETTTERIIMETGAEFIHPYNNPDVMSGQGTVALELIQQCDQMNAPLDALIVPVGGGGLLSGCITAAKALNPRIRIFAAEPSSADDCARSFAAKDLVLNSAAPLSVADGLLTNLGSNTWPIIRDNVESVHTVSDAQIMQAMRLVWERMKLVIEPSAATGLAVALFNKEFARKGGLRNIGIVFTGGNVDLGNIKWSW
ncbi:pyridoxal-5'-phosphate-dependent enzyme [Phlyctochytrium arcticum]|nr:pyridoxal-5'-phosphate-dependent enzyme [Phlyctochytrium arcticum]